jgi:hypothetical protein
MGWICLVIFYRAALNVVRYSLKACFLDMVLRWWVWPLLLPYKQVLPMLICVAQWRKCFRWKSFEKFLCSPRKCQGNSPELKIQLSVSDLVPKVHRTCISGAFWVPCFVVLILLNWSTLLICGLVVSDNVIQENSMSMHLSDMLYSCLPRVCWKDARMWWCDTLH